MVKLHIHGLLTARHDNLPPERNVGEAVPEHGAKLWQGERSSEHALFLSWIEGIHAYLYDDANEN